MQVLLLSFLTPRSPDRPRGSVAQPAATTGLPAPSGYYAPPQAEDRENYARYRDNPVMAAQEQPVSTFGVDVDTGSYTNVRRLLNEGQLPPADDVRAEAFINYFDYGYAAPDSQDRPVSIATDPSAAPEQPARRALETGLQSHRVGTH